MIYKAEQLASGYTCECGRKYRILGGITAKINPDEEVEDDDSR